MQFSFGFGALGRHRPGTGNKLQGLGSNAVVRRLNWLARAINAKSYLEIGVSTGKTFREVRVKTRHAVDPWFRFDTRELADRHTHFYEMTSDEYFTRHITHRAYDLVFIDGLHTYEQTFRDFCAVLPYTHARTVILIDDTLPRDPYSALPDAQAAAEQSAANGHSLQGWHGDVYKLVFAIHDFFPTLSYATIDRAKGQTLVWREPRRDFKPLTNSHEAISRMTWQDMQDNLGIMKCGEQGDALDRAITGVFSRK